MKYKKKGGEWWGCCTYLKKSTYTKTIFFATTTTTIYLNQIWFGSLGPRFYAKELVPLFLFRWDASVAYLISIWTQLYAIGLLTIVLLWSYGPSRSQPDSPTAGWKSVSERKTRFVEFNCVHNKKNAWPYYWGIILCSFIYHIMYRLNGCTR